MGASERIKSLAAEHGFPLCGVAAVPADGRAPGAERFEAWLARGFHGPLAYLHESAAPRINLKARFPWAKSMLCVGARYRLRSADCGMRIERTVRGMGCGVRSDDKRPRNEGQGQVAAEAATTALLRDHVAQYAWGRDYHLVFNRRLKALAKVLVAERLCAHARWYVDTGPVLERAWAAAAGLGWIGKNTCLVHPRGGSHWVLGEIILDAELDPDAPLKDHCGTCERCLKACPTGALVAPRVLDARRCLATWNLELRNETPETLWTAQRGWAAGCDACQEVCPYNAPGRATDCGLRIADCGSDEGNGERGVRGAESGVTADDAELSAPAAWHEMTLAEAIVLTRGRYDRDFRASALRRTGFRGLRLGAITAAAGLKDARVRAALRACLDDTDEGIRTRAAWALRQ